MKSKTILGADGTTEMREITVGIHGKGGEVGIRAVQRIAGMVSSLKQCKTPQEVYDRYLQILVRAKHEKQRAERLAEEYAKRYACCFCRGRNLHTCTGYSCKEPYQRAYDYAKSELAAGCMVVKIE